MVSFALVVCVDPAAALAQAWDRVQEETVGEAFESGETGALPKTLPPKNSLPKTRARLKSLLMVR